MNEEKLETMRHSGAHIMAAAIYKLFSDAKFGIGPAIADGFYYDIELPRTLIPEDLENIQKEMKAIIKANLPFEREEINRDKAIELFTEANQPYKVELLKEMKDEKVSIYRLGDFVDLCRGPHLDSSGEMKTFELDRISGAYWRGDEKNQMLQRVYGLAFPDPKELRKYLKMREEAKKRDHRKLGKELELFMFDDEVGAGLPLWMPKGAILRKTAMDFAFNKYLTSGYEPLSTPHIASEKLWTHSGHLDFYADDMYSAFGIDEVKYRLKPMNCPLHVKIYKNRRRSYRELPLRWAEMGTVYRYERAGVLHGLTRVRGFTQDDAHIICTPEQMPDELEKAFQLTEFILTSFGFDKKDFEVNLSIRDPKNKDKFIGDDKSWEQSQETLIKVLEKNGYSKDKIVVDEGGAVFYGPKIDVKVKDAIGREWQLSTIQFDFNLPSRFEMTYKDKDGKEKTPFMIHRALLGSLERFLGVLIEHYAGAFPLWLAPVQVKVLPVAETFNEDASKVCAELRRHNLRVELDDDNESVGKKIRQAELQKTPYMIVFGKKEKESGKLAVRKRKEKKQEELTIEDLTKKLKKEVLEKK